MGAILEDCSKDGKTCIRCKAHKGLCSFYTKGKIKDGNPRYESFCKVCKSKKSKKNRQYKNKTVKFDIKESEFVEFYADDFSSYDFEKYLNDLTIEILFDNED